MLLGVHLIIDSDGNIESERRLMMLMFLGVSEFGASNRGGTLEADSPYHDLANAIIVQATKDYKVAKKKQDTKAIDSLTDFFHGGWFSTLTQVNPDYILERL